MDHVTREPCYASFSDDQPPGG